MASHEDRSWMRLPRHSEEWKTNFRNFIANFGTSSSGRAGGSVACPCATCQCMIRYHDVFQIQVHLVTRGFADCFINNELLEGPTCSSSAEGRVNHGVGADLNTGIREEHEDDSAPYFGEDDEEADDDPAATNTLIRNIISGSIHGQIIDDGEEPNKDAEIFLKLLEEAKKELYPGCKDATKVSFIVQLFQIKCLYGISNSALEAILKLFSKVLPEGHCIPDSLDKVKRVVRDLGLDYIKIHACKNDCVLFFKENAKLEECPVCGESRWRLVEKSSDNDVADGTVKTKRLPVKILRYFPLIPRLQRMYMSK